MAFSPKLLQQGASGAGGYQISRSLRFNSADSTYLNKTLVTPTNNKIWTWSAWVKRASLGVTQRLFFANGVDNIWFNSDDTFYVYIDSGTYAISSVQVFRDPSAWYHIMITADTTQVTSSNRLKMYVNGAQITSLSSATYPTQNFNTYINSAVAHGIGAYGVPGSQNYFDGYMTEVNFVDGQQLTPSSFGQTDAQTGVWKPKAYSGSYGTNGFYLNFSDNSNTTAATLGKDYSGNGNNWTPNNFSVTAGAGNDSFVDVPTSFGTDTGVGGTVRGNYAVINPLQLISNVTVSNGNLYFLSNNNTDQWASAPSTIAVRTGKWYAEFTPTNSAGTPSYGFGVVRATWSPIILDAGGYYGRFWYTTEGYSYLTSGSFYTGNSISSSGAAFVSGDIIGVALDLDAGSITFYKNGVSQGTPFTSIPLGVDYVFAGGAFTSPYPTPTNIGAYFANFGQRAFAYTAPSGYKALCTQNLPTPTIGATSATLANKYFKAITYTGNGSQSVTGVGFQPDWVWVKSRSSSVYNHQLHDAVRGATAGALFSNLTSAQDATYQFDSFDSDGFTTDASNIVGINNSGYTFVAWNWNAGGSTVTNTSGSISSQVRASTTSGFSVVTYTGNDTANQTIGHGLGVAPSMVIVKSRGSTAEWVTYQSVLGANKFLYLNQTTGESTVSGYWGTPSSTTFGIKGGGWANNVNGVSMVAYCFAPIAGYSAFGSYTGNGSTNGPFIHTGFRPAWFMIKASSAVDDWAIIDVARNPYNAVNFWLNAEDTSAEATLSPPQFDLNSNGMKLRGTSSTVNGSGVTYIYMAFAENPFKYSLAR